MKNFEFSTYATITKIPLNPVAKNSPESKSITFVQYELEEDTIKCFGQIKKLRGEWRQKIHFIRFRTHLMILVKSHSSQDNAYNEMQSDSRIFNFINDLGVVDVSASYGIGSFQNFS